MAIRITNHCLNCGACEPECPQGAIYEGGAPWRWSDATKLSGAVTLATGFTTDAAAAQAPLQQEYYYVVPGKCNECVGYHVEPQCQAVCPADAFVLDPDHQEPLNELLDRARWLQQSNDPFTPYAQWLKTQKPTLPPSCGCGGH
jgi:ferredoxin